MHQSNSLCSLSYTRSQSCRLLNPHTLYHHHSQYATASTHTLSHTHTRAQTHTHVLRTAPLTHTHTQVPLHYSSQFPAAEFTPDFAVYNGMVNAGDQIFGNLTAALRDAGMYNDTLIVMSSDNGGPASVYTSSKAANNFPLRSMKDVYTGHMLVSRRSC